MQRELALMGQLDSPAVAPSYFVNRCHTYRDAVRMAWAMRRVKYMTKAQLASEACLYPSHISDYLAEDDKPSRRDLPACAIARFEATVGNTLVSQWIANQSMLTVLEEMQADRLAA